MYNKDLRARINKIRAAQTIITEETTLIYNEVSDVLENSTIDKDNLLTQLLGFIDTYGIKKDAINYVSTEHKKFLEETLEWVQNY